MGSYAPAIGNGNMAGDIVIDGESWGLSVYNDKFSLFFPIL